jgi:hypothetical protein
MKKTFTLVHPKIAPARLAETIRSDIRKYVKRERRRALPEGFDFWDFDCKYGAVEAEAKGAHLAELGKHVQQAEKEELESFYIEILAKPAKRTKKKPVTAGK